MVEEQGWVEEGWRAGVEDVGEANGERGLARRT